MIEGIKYIGWLERFETIIAESPLDEIWHWIDFFNSEQTLAGCTPPVNKSVIPFICQSIVQAEEYKASLFKSGEHIKPLLLYYCLHNLTKAILAIETSKIPLGYHGLKKVEIPPSNSLLDVSAQVDQGVFWDLLLLKGFTPQKDVKLTFDELLKRCVYMPHEYHLAYKKKSEVIIPSIEASLHLHQLEISFIAPDADFEKNWQSLLPELDKYFDLIDFTSNKLTFGLKSGVQIGSIDKIQNILDEIVIVSVFPGQRSFLLPISNPVYAWSQDIFLFALSFILSSLVRYYPDYWYHGVIGNKTNRWIVRKLTYIIERVYPNLMINILFGKKFYRFSTHN
jgi:hypothetical protein